MEVCSRCKREFSFLYRVKFTGDIPNPPRRRMLVCHSCMAEVTEGRLVSREEMERLRRDSQGQ
jgi:hypothetical protein